MVRRWPAGLRASRVGALLSFLVAPAGRSAWGMEPPVSAPIEAGAGARTRADSLIEEGVRQREAGDDAQALEMFRRAHRLHPSAESLAQQALAEQALGLWLEAHAHLAEALDERHPFIARHGQALRSSLAEIELHLGRVEIQANVDAVRVTIDDHDIGVTPFAEPLPAIAGSSVLVASAPGYYEVSRRIRVDVGGLTRVRLAMTPLPSVVGPPAEVDEVSPWASYSFFVAASGVTLGAFGWVYREVNVARYNDDERCLRADRPRSEVCSDERSAFRAGELIAVAGISAGAVFGALGVGFWLTSPQQPEANSLACGVGLAGVLCTHRF